MQGRSAPERLQVTDTRRSSGTLIERDQPKRYDLVPGCMALFCPAGLGRSGERAERLLRRAG
jgi:hypothetical protein